jgi:hypothetical protein
MPRPARQVMPLTPACSRTFTKDSESMNQISNRPVVLILAGGDISQKLPFIRAGCSCPALIPVHTKPLAAQVIKAYEDVPAEIHLFVDQVFVSEVSREIDPHRFAFELHGLPLTNSVIETLRHACTATTGDDIIVNLVTSVPTAMPACGEVQVASIPRRGNWAAVSNDASGVCFHRKGSRPPEEARAFIGIFRTTRHHLEQALSSTDPSNDLLCVVEQIAAKGEISVNDVEWLDFGHEGNYHKSLAKLISSRSFNTIRVDPARGTLVKSSSDIRKLSLEADYFAGLPERLKVLFPRLLSRRDNGGGTESYEMEYYGYPSLAEYLLFWNLTEETWWRAFESLDSVLALFREHPASIGPKTARDFLWGKTLERVHAYLATLQDADFRSGLESGNLTINGRQIPRLGDILDAIEASVGSSYDESHFCIYHGDFCFNNILFDHSSGVVRLIDPRGSFGSAFPGIYGDQRYDLAKLAHSTTGGYDFIVNGLYELRKDGRNWTLKLAERRSSLWLGEMTDWIVGRSHGPAETIPLITASLFLSMCPLHADDPRRQVTMFLRGMELAATYMSPT